MNEYKEQKRKATMDDGMNPELVEGAELDGYFGIPTIKKPDKLIIPTGITPFTQRNRITDSTEAIGFYEKDPDFADILINPEIYAEEFNDKIVISPDCSCYRNASLSVQITNTYRNRAIGFYLQKNGAYVIPQVRWGNALTYTTQLLPEKIAFLGVEKHSIVAIGTYGCISSREDKVHFKAGLKEMLLTLKPEIVLVYGGMPNFIFKEFLATTHFIQYPDWIKRKKRGGK